MKEILKLCMLIMLVLGLIYGWIANLINLISMEPFVFTAKTIIGIGGVFMPPIGAIMGIFIW